jgi:hypothetical protein
MYKKSTKVGNQPPHKLLNLAGAISLTSLHAPTQKSFKKLGTSPGRRFIDVTLKKDLMHLSHQSSSSLLPPADKLCINRSSLFDTERSILSSVSVNSVQFTVPRATSERKKILTITCQKYEDTAGKKVKTESNLGKCNSIKLFRKFI